MVITGPGKYVMKNGEIETVTAVSDIGNGYAYGDAFTTDYMWSSKTGQVIGSPDQFSIVRRAD